MADIWKAYKWKISGHCQHNWLYVVLAVHRGLLCFYSQQIFIFKTVFHGTIDPAAHTRLCPIWNRFPSSLTGDGYVEKLPSSRKLENSKRNSFCRNCVLLRYGTIFRCPIDNAAACDQNQERWKSSISIDFIQFFRFVGVVHLWFSYQRLLPAGKFSFVVVVSIMITPNFSQSDD